MSTIDIFPISIYIYNMYRYTLFELKYISILFSTSQSVAIIFIYLKAICSNYCGTVCFVSSVYTLRNWHDILYIF